MKLLKHVLLLSFSVLLLSGCTESKASSENMVMEENFVPSEIETSAYVIVDRTRRKEKVIDPLEFDWEQVDDDVEYIFMDTDIYPLSVNMEYQEDIDSKNIELLWILKNEATDDDAMIYATEMVQQFNDILAVQKSSYSLSSAESFGDVWDTFSLSVKILKEDNTVLINKEYDAGESIDLELPQYTSNGPKTSDNNIAPDKN